MLQFFSMDIQKYYILNFCAAVLWNGINLCTLAVLHPGPFLTDIVSSELGFLSIVYIIGSYSLYTVSFSSYLDYQVFISFCVRFGRFHSRCDFIPGLSVVMLCSSSYCLVKYSGDSLILGSPFPKNDLKCLIFFIVLLFISFIFALFISSFFLLCILFGLFFYLGEMELYNWYLNIVLQCYYHLYITLGMLIYNSF